VSLDFTAIDFETANRHRGSACSVGLVKVRDGVPVDFASWLIRPPVDFDSFDFFNVNLHGITAEAVADQPRWPALAQEVFDYIGSDVLVAHNARFDLHVLRSTCYLSGVDYPSLSYLCSLLVARRTYSLPSHRLPFVAQAAGVQLENHHNAASDALAAADITVAMARRYQVDDLVALSAAAGVRIGGMTATTFTHSAVLRPNHGLVKPTISESADPDHPLFGQVVVFTGGMATMTRQEGWEVVASRGAVPEQNVTKRTNILVAADVDPRRLVPGAMLSQRAAKAMQLQAKGQVIEVMTEDDLLRAL
jgi:DNA polymerase-3 subunit epsilon